MQIKEVFFILLFTGFCERSFGGMLGAGGVRRYYKKMKNTNYSVKKLQSYGFLLIAMLLCSPAQAKVDHYVGGYAQIGEWSLLPSKSDYAGSIGVAGGVGFQYELQAGKKYRPTRFLMDLGVGATGGMTAYMQSSSKVEKLLNQEDLEHDRFDYVYDIQDRKDRYTNIAVHVPIMFGIQYKRFYALAGMKVYANIYTKSHSNANLTTYGDYVEFDLHRNMPEYQFFEDKKVSTGMKTSLNLDLDLSFEIGGRLGNVLYDVGYDVPKSKIEYRLAAFMDYGLLDIHSKGTKSALKLPERYDINPESQNYIYWTTTMIDNLEMNDVMSTNGFASAVKNLVVGIKFTILFQLPEQGQCVICRDNYRSSARTYTGSRRGMKYEE